MPDRVHNVEGQAWGGERVLTLGRKLDPYHGSPVREAFLKYVDVIFRGMMSKNLKHAAILKTKSKYVTILEKFHFFHKYSEYFL